MKMYLLLETGGFQAMAVGQISGVYIYKYLHIFLGVPVFVYTLFISLWHLSQSNGVHLKMPLCICVKTC